MEDYTIYTYNPKTKTYAKIGSVVSNDTKTAKSIWANENNWKPSVLGEVLFAKGPICR